MIVASVSRGHSFKGVAAYLVNGHAGGQDRAEWTAVANTATDDVLLAARFMAATALDATRKQPKGAVWHTVISFDPTRHPDREFQELAARDMLKALGLEKAQAIIAAHNDNERKLTHVHVVINVIDHETRRIFADPSKPGDNTKNVFCNSDRKMQAWALEFCREHGITDVCPNREKNAQLREQAKKDRATDPSTPAPDLQGHQRLSRPEWIAMKDALFTRQQIERDRLYAQHGAQWASMKAEHAQRQAAERAQWKTELARQKAAVKVENKGQWGELFKQQRAEVRRSIMAIEKARRDEQRARSLVGRALAVIGMAPTREEAVRALVVANIERQSVNVRHEGQRSAKAKAQGNTAYKRAQASMEAVRAVQPDRVSHDVVRGRQAIERDRLREQQMAERKAAGIKERARQGDRASVDQEALRAEAERRERLTDGITRSEQVDRQQRAGTHGRPLSDEAKRRAEDMRARDRDDRKRGRDDRERER